VILPVYVIYVWSRFVVLRTTILVTEKEAEKMTKMLYTILTHRLVTMVLRQKFVTNSNMSSAHLHAHRLSSAVLARLTQS